MRKTRHLCFIKKYMLLLWLFCAIAFGGTMYAVQPVTPAQWQQLTSDKAFGYKNDRENLQASQQQYNPGFFQKMFKAVAAFFNQGYGNILFWMLVAGVLIYVVYRLASGKGSFLFARANRQVNADATIKAEEDISSANWELLIQQAAAANDIRLVVRYSYMRLLQILQKRNLIQYHTGKTNYEYYQELSNTVYKLPFRQLSRQYEYAWYGGYPLSDAAYEDYIALFNNVKSQLGV